MKIADIIINVTARSLNQAFSYALPSELEYIEPGWRVIVPFGNRKAEGFVISVTEGDSTGLKFVQAALDNVRWFDAQMLNLAEWIASYYVCNLAEALRLFVPGKKGIKIEQYCYAETELTQVCQSTLDLPEDIDRMFWFITNKQPVRIDTLTRQFGSATERMLKFLVNHHLVTIRTQAKTREKIGYIAQYRLKDPQTISEGLASYTRKPAQMRLLELLLENESMTKDELKLQRISADAIKRLLDAGVINQCLLPKTVDSYADRCSAESRPKFLNQEQTVCVNQIEAAISAGYFHSFLLHGVTGSGKTEVYLQAVSHIRAKGLQAIVLVPEIALTGQIVDRFKSRFGDDVVVVHSKLSLQERYDSWRRLRECSAGIVIGARSAIFAPTPNLGLIVIDEEHEFTYKQEESPRYHAREIALKRAQLCNAVVILGSATPSIESYYSASSGRYTLLELTKRADNALLPTVKVVDMREEMALGRRSVISEPLGQLLADTIQRGEQAIILLNRRGHSTFLLCRECGHVIRCSHCAVSLVYHADTQILRCHYCRHPEPVPDICPACQSRYIRYFGAGTQKAEEELKRLLPSARLLRMDQDTTGARFAVDNMLSDFKAGKYDILLGTQMVAKGHDIANVTAVGILAADTTLNLPDFRAAEKSFALITQAAGRAGRGNKPGTVIVQTYNPDHYAVLAGAQQDYKRFYAAEMEFRRTLNYPPHASIIRITITGEDENTARRDAEELSAVLRSLTNERNFEILGPFPSAIAKVKDVFRMNILMKADDFADIKQRLPRLPNLSKPGISIDVDPYNML